MRDCWDYYRRVMGTRWCYERRARRDGHCDEDGDGHGMGMPPVIEHFLPFIPVIRAAHPQ